MKHPHFHECRCHDSGAGVSAKRRGGWAICLSLLSVFILPKVEAAQAGNVTAWGTQVINPLTGYGATYTKVATGGERNLALKQDGTVVAWGRTYDGLTYVQSTVPAGLSGVTAIAAGGAHNLALKQGGTVVAWGRTYDGLTYVRNTVPAGLSGVTAIAAGDGHSLALKQDGTVVAWGSNGYGESMVPAGLSGVMAIAAGGNQSLALFTGSSAVRLGLTLLDGKATIRCFGLPDLSYTIEASDNLRTQNWEKIGEIAAAGASGLIEFIDPDARHHQTRYYRAHLP